jgi:hypothetical protein
MKKISFLLIGILLFSCSKTPNQQSTTLKITPISPVNNGSIKKSIDAEFTWSLSASEPSSPVYSGIKIVEILGNESPEYAFATNKPFFEKDSLIAVTIVIKPSVGTPGFGLDKKYVWQLTAKQKSLFANSSLSVFTVVP